MDNTPVRVLAFVSEILSAKTLLPIIGALKADPGFDVRIANDGFCREFIQSLDLPVEYLLEDFESKIDTRVRQANVVLMGKSYVQRSEYTLLERAAHWKVPVFMVVPDMGIDIVRAKLRGIGDDAIGAIPWPMLMMADARTRESLRSLSVPDDRVVEFGNPYFDELYFELDRDLGEWDPDGIGYFSTPFELDFTRGILPADYRQIDLVSDIRQVCTELSQPLTAKRHPQVEPALFEGMDVFEGTPLELIRKIRVAVGSYSTTLLEAFAAGIPAISYQPWQEDIRSDVFAGRIPIVKSRTDLKEAIKEILELPEVPRTPECITYNPRASLCVAIEHIGRMSNRAGLVVKR